MKVISTKSKIFFLLILIFFLVGCVTQLPTGQVVKQITCNKPYILVGNDCCLDEDDNSICDKDEAECNKPYIQVGTDCCLDKNKNKICDKDEIPQEETEKPKALTIENLQTDMGDIIGDVIVLTKDQELDYAQVYSNKVENTHFLGKYGITQYSKLITKKRQKVIQITDSKHYLRSKEDFQNFVIENKDLFIETALKSKELFENDLVEGDFPKLIYLAKKNLKGTMTTAEKAEYVNHSEISSIVHHDNINFQENFSQNLADITYVRVNKYEMIVNHPTGFGTSGYTEKLSNINYGQSIVVKCSPNWVIVLSFEDYGDGISKHERNYDRYYVDSDYFLTHIRDHYQELIKDSQALVKMCEQRYQFTYVRAG